jgi:hypothetical protein
VSCGCYFFATQSPKATVKPRIHSEESSPQSPSHHLRPLHIKAAQPNSATCGRTSLPQTKPSSPNLISPIVLLMRFPSARYPVIRVPSIEIHFGTSQNCTCTSNRTKLCIITLVLFAIAHFATLFRLFQFASWVHGHLFSYQAGQAHHVYRIRHKKLRFPQSCDFYLSDLVCFTVNGIGPGGALRSHECRHGSL